MPTECSIEQTQKNVSQPNHHKNTTMENIKLHWVKGEFENLELIITRLLIEYPPPNDAVLRALVLGLLPLQQRANKHRKQMQLSGTKDARIKVKHGEAICLYALIDAGFLDFITHDSVEGNFLRAAYRIIHQRFFV